MFLQEMTPDTSGYMIAGYLIAFVVIGLYIASIYLRSRNLKQDMSMLEEMEKSFPAGAEQKEGAKTVKPVTKSHAEN